MLKYTYQNTNLNLLWTTWICQQPKCLSHQSLGNTKDLFALKFKHEYTSDLYQHTSKDILKQSSAQVQSKHVRKKRPYTKLEHWLQKGASSKLLHTLQLRQQTDKEILILIIILTFRLNILNPLVNMRGSHTNLHLFSKRIPKYNLNFEFTKSKNNLWETWSPWTRLF